MAQKKRGVECRTRNDVVFDAVNGVLVALVILACAYPIYYTIIASFSDPAQVISGNVFLWVKDFTLDSYRSVLQYTQVWQGYANTLLYTACGTVYNLFLLLPASYAMAKHELKGRNILMVFFVFTMYFSGGTVPMYLQLRNMDLINNPVVMILPGAFSVYNMIITRTYFAGFPESLKEAATIDGAGELRIFLRIVMPLSGAIVAVMTLYHAVGHWNSYFNALIYLNDREYYPLQLVMRQVLLMNSAISVDVTGMDAEALADLLRRQRLAETMKYSLIIVANLPVLVAYPFVQKYFVKGVMIGSLKG